MAVLAKKATVFAKATVKYTLVTFGSMLAASFLMQGMHYAVEQVRAADESAQPVDDLHLAQSDRCFAISEQPDAVPQQQAGCSLTVDGVSKVLVFSASGGSQNFYRVRQRRTDDRETILNSVGPITRNLALKGLTVNRADFYTSETDKSANVVVIYGRKANQDYAMAFLYDIENQTYLTAAYPIKYQ